MEIALQPHAASLRRLHGITRVRLHLEPPQFRSCNCALTVVHIILECQQYNSVRQKYFSLKSYLIESILMMSFLF